MGAAIGGWARWRAAETYQVDHVRGEEGNSVLLEELLVLVKHAIEPREELLGTVVGVDWRQVSAAASNEEDSALTDDGNAVERSHGADVVGGSDGAANRRLLLLGAVLDALAGEVGGTALACLEANHGLSMSARNGRTDGRTEGAVVHDRGLGIAGGLESGDGGAAGRDVGGGDGETLLAGVGEELQHIVACSRVNLSSSDLGGEGCVP